MTSPDRSDSSSPSPSSAQPKRGGLTDGKGWDGKLRVERAAKAVLLSPDAPSDPDESGEDERGPAVESVPADADLLEDVELGCLDIDLVHCGISSMPALGLERFTQVAKICLRLNLISRIELPPSLGGTVTELDLYDNLISHVRGLDGFVRLASLDLSFNRIKRIGHVDHLKELTDLYFVQNKIQTIQGLHGLTKLRNLELAGNRIREIENIETLQGLEELWLGKNKITELKNLDGLSSLKILSIQSNRLRQLGGLSGLASLEELYVSHNAITHISGLDDNHRLRVLDISNNAIAHLTNLKHLARLEEVWASSNGLASFDELEHELADKPALTTVYLEGNPLQLQNAVLYRNKVRLALPQVKQIDATFVHA